MHPNLFRNASSRTKRLVLVAAGALLAAVPAASIPSLPVTNHVDNGGFELGLAGWTLIGPGCAAGGIALEQGGALLTPQALRVTNTFDGCFARQDIDAPEDAGLVSFWANRIAPGTGGLNVLTLHGNGPIGSHHFPLQVWFRLDELRVGAYQENPVLVANPSPGWHHYLLHLDIASHTIDVWIDGQHAATVQGRANYAGLAEEIHLGDTAGSDPGGVLPGAAPTIVWDELYYGPALPES